MFKLDNNLLIELGLGALPTSEKNKMLADIYEKLELRVGMRLAQQMSDEQLTEFEGFIDGDQGKARGFLDANKPGWDQTPEFINQLQEAEKRGIPQNSVISEYAALSWLETNFPDYKNVVADELETLKAEIKAHAPQMLEVIMAEQAQSSNATPNNQPANPQQTPPSVDDTQNQQPTDHQV